VAAAHVRRGVAAGLSALTPREALIVPWRYGLEAYEPQSRPAMGDRLGICHEHVRQLEKQALAHLRRFPQRAELVQ
jgi:DNA-directed RNA polymerase sigma subunit (sigma70/sigma32)